MSQSSIEVGRSTVDDLTERTDYSQAEIMGAVRVIGGAMIALSIMVVVLIEVFQLEAIQEAANDSDAAFSGLIDSIESTGAAALGLLVIGLLVIAANQIMGWFGNGGM